MDGRAFNVIAPTRTLAILNLRATPRNCGAIASIRCNWRCQSLAGYPVVAEIPSHVAR